MMRSLQRALAAALSAALILLSPGFEPYAAAGGNTSSAGGGHAAAPLVLPSIDLNAPAGSLTAPSFNTGLTLPSIQLAGFSGAQTVSAQRQALSGAQASGLQARSAQPGATARQTGGAAFVLSQQRHTRATLPQSGRAAEIAVENIVKSNSLTDGAPSAAFGAGRELENALTGRRSASEEDLTPSANLGVFDKGDGFFFAKPAGDSIREANEANVVEPQAGGGSNVPAPPQNGGNGGGSGRDSNDQGGPRIPLAARLISSLLALAPIALIAWPLLAAGSTVLGALVVAASVGYAAFPFMSASTPKFIRALPGVGVGLLGFAGVGLGIATGGVGLAAVGALAALGGWGFTRFAKNDTKWRRRVGDTEVLLTMLGMLGAIASVGLAAAPVVGVAALVKLVAIPATLPLLMHLPGWIGDSITNTVAALFESAKQSQRTASSIRRDTSLLKRLTVYSSAAVEQSSWNFLWLGLVIWLPLLVSEAVQFVVGVAVGLLVGALKVPLMVAWTITHHFANDSALNKRLAFAGRSAQLVSSKAGYFNAMEKPFVGLANSDSFFKRLLGAGLIRASQLAWLATVPAATILTSLKALAFAGAETSKPYDANLHNPNIQRAPRDTAGDSVPDVQKPARVPGAVPARILASALGFAPFVLLTLPAVFGGGLLGGLLFLTGAAIALMPLIPAKSLPAWLAKAPGDLLTLAGGFTAFGAARYMLVGLPAAPLLGIGIVALLAGLGLRNLVDKLRNNEKKLFYTDDWRYSLGYVGALGTVAALSAALAGAGGALATVVFWAGAVSSLALLAHLPKYLWSALYDTVAGAIRSIGQAYRALGVWHRKTDFARNYMKWMGSMIKRWTVFAALLPAILLVPMIAVYLAELATSVVVGAALGLFHAPGLYAWSAAYHKDPKSRATRFWAGFNRVFYDRMEGARATRLEPWAQKYASASNSANEYGRPTLRAFGGLLMTAVGTLFWLFTTAAAIILTPVLAIVGVVNGIKRASEPAPADSYADSPERVFSR